MNIRLRAFTLAMVLTLISYVQAQNPRTPGGRLTAHQFRSVMQTIPEGWNRGNAQLAVSCFAEDAVYSAPPSSTHRGRQALYDFFGGSKGRELPMHMTWHNLVFDADQQIGVGEYTFRYRIQTHGIVIVKIGHGLISHWREYEVESSLPWEEFIAENRF